ncbi:hydrogenase maturation nickel metallochaperone HypA [Marinobacterium arenosum]|uniref:hydrogenase maturation nickel metallochaperone HypA n=1 Tax=Marinobacterium arenosum TaxID=2862496 RepID=UPI001C983862|nr:hydrogenase maturation nickel metallochaperone HypA [Marinobacterium arenosum]MBY4677392.1 hydrogenase maturation nickel metallochaperone HypA [Marinobacterium arenosum]
MHEMSIAEGIVQLLEQQAVEQQYRRVRTVWLEIGPLAAVETEALRFCFEAVTRDSLAEGARLEIIELPASGWCLGCASQIEIRQRYDSCPACGSYQVQVTSGEELRIKELEVD